MKIHQILINDQNTLPEKFPDFHNRCYDQIKKLYPDAEYKIYSGEELEKILKENFDEEVITAYRKLKPYACKADLARACLLYLYGGLYIDLNIYLIDIIPNLENWNFFAFRDHSTNSKQYWSVQNCLMYSEEKSGVTANIINMIIDNCKIEYCGIDCIDVSSTVVLGRAIIAALPNFRVATTGQVDWYEIKYLPEDVQELIKSTGYTEDIIEALFLDVYDAPALAIRKPANKGDIESLGFLGTNSHTKMWEEKNVYDPNIKFNSVKFDY